MVSVLFKQISVITKILYALRVKTKDL